MKKGISIWAFGDKSVRDSIDLAKKAGYDGIELALNESGEMGLQTTEQELLEIKQYAADRGVELPSVATGLYWSYSLTDDDPAKRAKALEIAETQIRFAKILGGTAVLIVPGAVSVDFAPELGVVDYDVVYERSLYAFETIKKVAEREQIHVGIENVWNRFLLSPMEMRDFIDRIGSPYVGSYLDVGNVLYAGYPEQWIKILGKRIKRVHFKDYRKAVGTLDGFVDLLAGDIDYPAVVRALEAAGYDNYCTAEMIPPYKFYPEQIIYNTSGAMDAILGRKDAAK